MTEAIGLLVGVVEDPVVVKFECCDAMGFVQYSVLGKLKVDLAKFLGESGPDAFVDPEVGTRNGFFSEMGNMM
eukprot:12594339-Ditylum_brightwellii.AAC.1